jgi:hypothetical protein
LATCPRTLFAILLLFGVFVSAALGEGTRTWEQSKFDDLVKGTSHGVAIRSSGGLELAPAFKPLYTSPSTYIWSIAADGTGAVFAATGAPARVYQVMPDGQASVIFEPQELQVQALLVDKSGALFAATAPDGKVYKIERHAVLPKKDVSPRKTTAPESKVQADSNWSASVYFDPGTKYIWDLAQDSAGNLYVATGDHGEVFRVTPRGEHSLFFKSDEVHIRVLDIDPKGNLIAGSDGSGLVYRISPSGQAFVLYSAPKKEITALAIDSAGNIYAAGAGEKRAGTGSGSFASSPVNTPAPMAGPAPSGIAINAPAPTSAPVVGSFPAPGAGASGGSEIYKIAPDGSPTRIWTSRDDLAYALAFDQRGRLLVGTGNRGHVFAILGEDNFIDLLKASATQVTAFAKAPGGGLYVSTSNLGKLFLLGPTPDTEGSYESDVFDAHIFSRWGRVEFRGAGNVELFTRSGNVDNPDRNWSPWTRLDLRKDTQASVPAARFIQWKTVLRAGTPPPRVDSVLLNYLPKNVAPDIDEVSVQVGARYQSGPKAPTADSSSGNSSQAHFDAPAPSVHDRDSIGVKWTAHHDNDDQMVYSLYYRGEGESRWLLLKDNLTDRFYSFDASLLPDGGYIVKVVASDAPSHSPSEALSSEKESTRFEIDTTPPHVENLHASADASQIHVSFGAVDSFSAIKRAEYSVDAGEWQFVEPIGQLSDSRSENYDFKVNIPSSESDNTVKKSAANGGTDGQGQTASVGEHVIVVRVYDRFDNMSSAKTVIGK